MTPAKAATALLGAASIAFALAGPRPAGAQAAPTRPPAKLSVRKAPAGRPLHHHAKAKAVSEVLVLAGCYGQFIAWRDELSTLMLQANSYTPWPGDHIRFDRMERAFAAGVRRDRKLTLILQPSFHESDLPPDIRAAFRAGLERASGAFAANGYRNTQIMVIGQPDLSPQQRMAQLEANADEAFAPLAAPCDRLAGQ